MDSSWLDYTLRGSTNSIIAALTEGVRRCLFAISSPSASGFEQQMRWTERGAHVLLQVRTRVLNEDLRATFWRWYPGLRADPEPAEGEAA